ncbi:MAG TPA: signal peptidase I [Anaerolineae bacterium]|nr:signal peptidase I [Anaerolineae bacterium]
MNKHLILGFACLPHLYYNARTKLESGGVSLEELQPEEAQVEQVPLTDSGYQRPPDGERVSLARAFGGRSLLRETLETILLTVIIFLVLNTATGRFQVRGSSMEPTLHDGQYLVIGKLVYWIHPPERGDVIVFEPPNNPSDDYIKRIVGLPGEQLEIRDRGIWIDGILLEEPYIASPGSYAGAWGLGEGEYFVLGDNRSNSSDSHSWGVLPRENIIGKAWLCYWPPEQWSLVAHYTFPEATDQGD